jgi:hypothetical protein
MVADTLGKPWTEVEAIAGSFTARKQAAYL